MLAAVRAAEAAPLDVEAPRFGAAVFRGEAAFFAVARFFEAAFFAVDFVSVRFFAADFFALPVLGELAERFAGARRAFF
jgi:hypothetical protein